MPAWYAIGSEVGIVVAVALALGAVTIVVVLRLLPPNVARLQARGRVRGLIRALSYRSSPRVRREAALALGTLDDRRAVEPLMAALADPDGDVRRQALLSLAALADERALAPLLEALTDADQMIRVVAADALGTMGLHEAIGPLAAAMEDESEPVRRAAIAALVTIGGPAIEPLIAALGGENRSVYFQACRALAIMADRRAVEPLVVALARPDRDMRIAAADALDGLGWVPGRDTAGALYWLARERWDRVAELGPGAVPLLLVLLDDPAPQVRLAAIATLGHIGDERAVAPLLARLKDADEATRLAAQQAFGDIGEGLQITAVSDSLRHPDWQVRASAAEMLAKCNDPEAVEPLVPLLADPRGEVCEAAADALDRLGWDPGGSELEARYYVIRQDWDKCVELGSAAVPAVIELLEDPDLRTRTAAARVLGRIRDGRAMRPLLGALDEVEPELVEAVFSALVSMGAPTIDLLTEALSDGREAIAATAAWALGQIGDPRALEPLVAALRHPMPAVQQAAAHALGSLHLADAVEPLVSALVAGCPSEPAIAALAAIGEAAVPALIASARHYDSVEATTFIAQALARIGAPAIEPLLSLLAEGNNRPRPLGPLLAAADALGRLGDGRAVEPLVRLFARSDPVLRQVIVQALDRLGWQPQEGEMAARYWILKRDWGRCAALGPDATTALLDALQDDDPSLVAGAATALGQGGDLRALEPLIAIARHPDSTVRAAVTGALGALGDTRAVMPLISAMQDPEVSVVVAAVAALGRVGAPGVPPLLEALRSTNADLRSAATRALAEIGGPAVTALIRALADRDLHVIIGAAEALGRIGDRRAVDPLLACLESDTSHVRQAVCQALGEIGDQRAVLPLTEMLRDGDYPVRFAAAAALGKLRDPRAIQPLIAALKHENPDVRAAAAEALGQSGDDWAIEPLLAVLSDPRFSVQVAAARALGNLGERAVRPLTQALRSNAHWNVRYAAAMALGLARSEQGVRALIDALQDDDSRVRWSAASALDKIGTDEARAATSTWRSAQDQVWDYVDAGSDRRLLEAETGLLTGARVYRLLPLKQQRLQEHDHLAISGTLTCACAASLAVADIDVALRRSLFGEDKVYTWTCPKCQSGITISGYITGTGQEEPQYWLVVQRDGDPTHHAGAGWPSLDIGTLSHGEFDQVFADHR